MSLLPRTTLHSDSEQNRFISHILSTRTAKFRSKIYLIPGIFRIHTDPFCVVSVYEQILSAFSQYTNRFFPRILSIRTDSLYVFGECAQIILNIQNGIIFITAFKGILFKKVYTVCVQLDQRPTRNNQLFGPSLTKKILSAYSDNMRNDLRIWISRQIWIIFKNILGSESGNEELAFDEKKRMLKISCKCTFQWCYVLAEVGIKTVTAL